MSQSDPTDTRWRPSPASSISPKPIAKPEKAAVDGKAASLPETGIEADGYSKVGPGPMAAIRFKWTVRREDNGEYYVDETIGENSIPSSADRCRGMPRSSSSTIARARRGGASSTQSEMTGRGAAANLVRKDGGET